MDKDLLLILLVGLVIVIWEYRQYKLKKLIDDRIQKSLNASWEKHKKG